MKKLLIAAAVVCALASGSAYAQKAQAIETCDSLADFTFAAVQMREEGYSRREARVTVIGAATGAPPENTKLLLSIVDYAYSEAKDAESTADDILVWCWNEFGVFAQ
jgi:hypothetical protein